MRKILPLLILSAICTADQMDQPDVNTQTLLQYINASSDPIAEAKIRQSLYLDSLNSEINRLADSLNKTLEHIPDLLEMFREDHQEFLLSTHLHASFMEKIEWYNLRTGECSYGSGQGEIYILESVDIISERIIFYKELLDSTGSATH